MAYSLDLRERVVAAVKEGMTQPEVAERFKVSLSSVERYVRREREGALRAKLPAGRAATIAAASYGALVSRLRGTTTQPQGALQAVAPRARGERERVHHVRDIATLGAVKETKTLAASEQNPEARAAW